MRVFLGINFEDAVKQQIEKVLRMLKPQVRKGRFVAPENLHLTLEFLGEVNGEQVENIKEIMNSTNHEKFTLNLKELGHFKTRKGRIVWLGVERNETLFHLQNELHKKLKAKQFELDERDYLPHITIGRRVKFKTNTQFDEVHEEIKRINIKVESFELMESKFDDGVLIYSPLYSKNLAKNTSRTDEN